MSESLNFIHRKRKSLLKLITELEKKHKTVPHNEAKILWDEFLKYHELVLDEFKENSFVPLVDYNENPEKYYSGEMIQIMKTTIQGIDDALPNEQITTKNYEFDTIDTHQKNKLGNDIFIVHGHDNEAKQETARFIEKLNLNAVILHERPNKGRTIIEKLVDESKSAGYAIILLTPDDIGFVKGKESESEERARQNVVLELGYFLGKLGRERVCMLLKGDTNIPNDFSGVLYISMDNAGKWKYDLAKEMQEAGFKIDLNSI